MKTKQTNLFFSIGIILFLAYVSFGFTISTEKSDSKENKSFPMFGNWKNFTKADGLPGNKTYAVRVDGDRVLVGTHEGLAVFEDGKWTTYTTSDGLAHNGVIAIDISELTGDVWLGTMGGLTRWSGGRFESFTQMNSGMPNDLVYSVACDGKDVWMATGGGAGKLDTYTKEWEIFTEENAPMHEPWTYSVCSGDEKIFIAAWGGGIIEYNKKTKHFRDYTDPDGNMEIDLFPDDGVVHDITTGTSFANGNLWVATYFGLSRYDGVHWKGYFDHDSGLASNFINFIKADGDYAFICTDQGLTVTDGDTWVSYYKNEKNANGRAVLLQDGKKQEKALSPSISHNFILGVDVKDDVIWVATSYGLSRGELIK
ncbi:hypothetical protein [uncultured Draconibacterium sp.]|uniref:ligand-binding sensor domain-containing protein n=1 Tax=uncultured Draconibacterium sp. TaxID=1573823 RepID=UPI003217B494